MSLSTQRAAVKALMIGISGVDAVADYERYSNEAEDFFVKHFVRKGRVNGFFIRADVMQDLIHSCSEVEKRVRFTVKGWLSATDDTASMKDAEDLMQTISDTFTAARTITSTATHSDPIESQPIITGMAKLGKGEYLVHQLVFTFVTYEVATVTYS